MDENVNHHLAKVLRTVFPQVGFTSVFELRLIGLEDVALFPRLNEAGVNGIVTLDYAQMLRPLERDGLRESRLHWVGLPKSEGKGFQVHSQNAAVLMQGLEAILSAGLPDLPHQFRIDPPANRKRDPFTAVVI